MISGADKQSFFDQGYLVVPGVVPALLCEAAVSAICRHLTLKLDDPSTWYVGASQGHGIVPVHHDPVFWAIRQLPAIHQVFADLYNTGHLWVTMDRASFKPPAHGWGEKVYVDPIHWDGDPRLDSPLSIQGLVYLTDTAADQGAFCCVPGAFRSLSEFLLNQTEDALSRLRPDLGDHVVEAIAAPAGSLVLWHRKMPHSSAENLTAEPRFTQYVAMDLQGDENARQHRIELFSQKRPPAWAVRQNVPDQQIPETGPEIVLTELGRKLVGVDRW
ncbi:MAG: phytanoyl-CoA dioxygenase family protein [Proteobacteria bacterium]|nr:phytanoyl-CoA dioxygenase family protein [Pseudomonadota bacterium]